MTSVLCLRRTSVLLVLVLAIVSSHAKAGGNQPFEPVDAEKLIKACWDISEEARASGVTAVMRSGTLDTVLCLEQVILDQVEVLFEPEYLSRTEAQKKLKRTRMAYGGLYWSIYNEHRGCDPMCGTIRHVFHLAENARILEKMIRDMVKERNEFEIAPMHSGEK